MDFSQPHVVGICKTCTFCGLFAEFTLEWINVWTLGKNGKKIKKKKNLKKIV